jgi:hypothetical protein
VISKRTASARQKQIAQQVALGLGQATAQLRILPNTLITGGQRCGTTSMYRALTQHPAVLKAVLHKGVHYFDTHYVEGLPWYRAHFPLKVTAHRIARRTSVRPVVLESSPYYGFHPLAAERIASDLPDVKLLVLIRDPVERAYSAHAHELARGFESVPFEAALDLEADRLAGEEARILADPAYVSEHHQHHGYVERGQYVRLLRHLEKAVGRERIHVVDSHLFFAQPEQTYRSVLKYLELPEMGMPVFDRHNARPRDAMSDATRRRLEEHFRPWDEQLSEWLGWTPSWRE